MQTRPIQWARVFRLVLIASTGAAAEASERPETPIAPRPGSPESFLVRIGEPATAGAVRHALAGAFERLADRRCAAVLDEFADASGTPLRARLTGVAPTPQQVLSRLFFYDGSHRPECRSRRAQASTEPGSRVILVCGLAFFEERTRNPERTEIWMIHEMLHALGAEENPPSSEEITRIVEGRCRDLD